MRSLLLGSVTRRTSRIEPRSIVISASEFANGAGMTVVEDWRRKSSIIQNKHGNINKEYEKYFPDKIDYIFYLLYVKYLSGGTHLNGKEYTKYEEDNETFCLRMSELYHQFYANCLDTFELFK